jgi:type VI secretion system secreted protein Hcp
MVKHWLFAGMVVLCAAYLSAQEPGLRGKSAQVGSSITVAVDGLSCTTPAGTGTFAALSWSFGANQTGTTGTASSGAGAGKISASLTSLNVSKRADSCSPVLFGDVVSGKFLKTVTLVQQDNAKDDVFTVTLTNVLVGSYQLGGDQSSEIPTEQISFTFSKICVSDTQSGTKFCWDTSTNRSF